MDKITIELKKFLLYEEYLLLLKSITHSHIDEVKSNRIDEIRSELFSLRRSEYIDGILK